MQELVSKSLGAVVYEKSSLKLKRRESLCTHYRAILAKKDNEDLNMAF